MKKNKKYELIYGNWHDFNDYKIVKGSSFRELLQFVYSHHDYLIELSKKTPHFSILISLGDDYDK